VSDLLSVTEAQNRIVAAFEPVPTEVVPLANALGRVLSLAVSAALDLPPFTNSSMDGFAIQARDIQAASASNPVDLALVADIPAGSTPSAPIGPGQAARIMTGAVLPAGADAVIPQESTRVDPAIPGQVRIFQPVQPGDYLRPKGSDLQAGEPVLPAGRRLLAQDLGLLAALGVSQVAVHRKPRVALLSSGDELAAPGEPLTPGKIYDSNSFTLTALVQHSGAQVIALGVARDDPHEVSRLLQSAAAQGADLILTSAGVSVGAFDYVRAILEQQGSLNFWRVNVRPGKPLAFGSYQNIPLIGLPGNPVSAFVGFLLFVAPAIRRLSGQTHQPAPQYTAVLDEPLDSDGRESYLRATVRLEQGKYHAKLAKNQSSANIYALVQANALLIVPSGVKSLPVGSEVKFIRIGNEGE
jgi:molybdopterin molybdotransferase